MFPKTEVSLKFFSLKPLIKTEKHLQIFKKNSYLKEGKEIEKKVKSRDRWKINYIFSEKNFAVK